MEKLMPETDETKTLFGYPVVVMEQEQEEKLRARFAGIQFGHPARIPVILKDLPQVPYEAPDYSVKDSPE